MKKSILLLALLCFTISNAQNLKRIKGNEKIVIVTRSTSEYDKISAAGSFDVKLISGKEGTISIKGDENLLQYIKTEVANGTLSVYFEKGKNIQLNYNSSIEITIPFEKIRQLTFTGSGNLSNSDTVTSENFEFTMSGSGNVKFVTQATNLKITKSGSGNLSVIGKSSNLEILSSGSGNANLSELTSENANAMQTGSGSISVFCSKNLQARTSGSGNINYKGNPEKVDKSSAGSGSITGN